MTRVTLSEWHIREFLYNGVQHLLDSEKKFASDPLTMWMGHRRRIQ